MTMALRRNTFVKLLLYCAIVVLINGNLKFGKAAENYDAAEVDDEINRLMRAKRQRFEEGPYQVKSCRTDQFKDIVICSVKITGETELIAHNERCVDSVNDKYITKVCKDGKWKIHKEEKKSIKKKGWGWRSRRIWRRCSRWWFRCRPANTLPYFTRCRPSQTTFYTPSGSSATRIYFQEPTAYDKEDGYIRPQRIKKVATARRRCSGWWWRRCRTRYTYYPHYGDYFTGSARGKTYSIAYRATDRRGACATCTFYITVKIGSCSTPYPPRYGSVSCPWGTYYGRTCYFSCQSGYIPSTTSTRCSNGQWSNGRTFTCTAQQCSSSKPTLSYGYYSCSSHYIGASCSPVCNSGYRLTGTHPIVCKSSRIWEKTGTVTCTDNAKPILHNCPGSITQTSESGVTSAVVTWAPPTATDNHDSANPVPVKISGAINSGDRVEAGTTHTIVYAATDVAGNQGRCSFTVTVTTISCGTLSSITNGYYTDCSHGFVYGSSCTYKCNKGYQLQGTSSLTCKADGTWSATIPTCTVRTCPSPVTLGFTFANGNYVCPASITYLTTCSANCNTGYTLEQTASILCRVDSSSNDMNYTVTGTPKCEDKEPPTFVNCPGGFVTFDLEADKGKTSTSLAYDVPEAMDSIDPDPVVTRKQGPEVGHTLSDTERAYVQFQATDASGNPSTICVFEFTVTVRHCPELVPPQGGSITCTADYIYGSVCNATCNTGYEIVDQRSTECLENLTWSDNLSCQKVQCPSPPDDFNNGNYSCQSTSTEYEYGTICVGSCNGGFMLQTPAQTTCGADRTWKPNVEPNCQDKQPPEIQDCEDTVTFTADQGSRSTTVTWAEPTAIDNSDPSPAVDKISGPEQGSVLEGEATVIYQAVDAAGITSNLCVTRLVVEVTECPSPVRPDHGEYSCNLDNIYGSSCSYTCNTGYELSDGGMFECQSTGTWSYGDSPSTCQIISCGRPEQEGRENGEYVCPNTRYEYQTHCVIRCNKGYSLKTGSVIFAKCLASKQWNYTSTEKCTDNTPPTFSSCNTHQTFYAAKASDGTNATWELPQATDNIDQPDEITINSLSELEPGAFVDVGETVVSYEAVDSSGNPSVENCNITLNVQDVICQHPNDTFLDAQMLYTCDDFKYGTNCTLTCNDTNYEIKNLNWTVCEANFTDGVPETYWLFEGEKPYCKEDICPETLNKPANGALVYTDPVGNNLPTAFVACNTNYDVPNNFDGTIFCRVVSGIANWDPSTIPDCTRSRRPGLSLLATKFYYEGDCNTGNKEEIRDFVLSTLSQTYEGTTYEFDSVTVECGVSRRKRDIFGSTGDIHLYKRQASDPAINVTVVLKTSCDVIDFSALLDCEDVLINEADRLKGLVEDGTLDSSNPDLTLVAESFQRDTYSEIKCGEGEVLEGLVCKTCSPGWYLDGTCQMCPVGSYTDTEAQIECQLCPEGQTTKGSASKSVEDCKAQCPIGYVSPDGHEPCVPCKFNEYQSEAGQTLCEMCPEEKKTFKTGSSECSYYDILLKPAETYTHDFFTVPSDAAQASFAVWYKKTSTDSLEFSLKDPSGFTIVSLILAENLTTHILESEDDVTEQTVPPNSDTWNHIAFSLHSSLDIYLNGNRDYMENLPSVVNLGDSVLKLTVTSEYDIRLSGIGWFDTVFDGPTIEDLYSSCLLGTATSKIFGPDYIVDKNLENVSIKPATCVAIDACLDDPCNGHLCSPKLYGLSCTCNNGYSGIDCSVEPDNCYENDCMNGATCVNLDSGYDCTCMGGYSGPLCEDPPVNGGWTAWSEWSICTEKCDSGTQQRTRTCTNPPPDPLGDDCPGDSQDTQSCNTVTCAELFPCLSSPCESGSTCVEKDSTFTCTCGPLRTGTLCETALDSCHNNVCQNEATCVPAENDVYSCSCTGLYTGSLCETKLSDESYWMPWSSCTGACNSQVSTRSKICVSSSADSTCVVDTEQRNCDTPCVDTELHCTSSPCGPHATCVEDDPTFRCNCETGYTGTSCTETIDHCVGMTCGQGTCLNSLTGYTCTCPEGYSGSDCSEAPTAGGWSDWTEWSECSVTCGQGQQTRDHLCNNPEPGMGGAPCLGEEHEEGTCNIDCSDACESHNCNGGHGECIVTESGPICHCNEAYTGERCETVRDPCNPDPCENGGVCSGTGTEFVCTCVSGYTGQICSEEPEVSVWEVWSEWSECSQDCGDKGGIQTRNRTCKEGTTGQDCVGKAEESLVCNNGTECPNCDDKTTNSYGVLISCNMTDGTKICSVQCREGLVVTNGTDAIGIYKCTNETGWDQTMVIPSCAKSRNSRGFNVRTSMSTSAILCAKTEQVTAAYQSNLEQSPCSTSSNCETRISVSGCTSNRRKRRDDASTITFEFVYNITETDTESGDTDLAIDELEDTMFLLENGTDEILTIDLDGETITLDNTNLTVTPTVDCPDGYFETEEVCVGCAPGTYYNSSLGFCVECEQGTYQEEQGQTSCISCDEGYYTNYTGSFNATDCFLIPEEYLTTEATPVTVSEDDSYAALIGGIVGGLLALLVLVSIVVFWWWKKAKSQRQIRQSNEWNNGARAQHPPLPSMLQSVQQEAKDMRFMNTKTPTRYTRETSNVSIGQVSVHEMELYNH